MGMRRKVKWREEGGRGQEFRSRQENPEYEEEHVIEEKAELRKTIQGPSRKRIPIRKAEKKRM
jgi:hypothetical protein